LRIYRDKESKGLPEWAVGPLAELSTFDLEDKKLPNNLNVLPQQPASVSPPPFLFLPFDFPTSKATASLISLGSKAISSRNSYPQTLIPPINQEDFIYHMQNPFPNHLTSNHSTLSNGSSTNEHSNNSVTKIGNN
jgi:hypothetical protein